MATEIERRLRTRVAMHLNSYSQIDVVRAGLSVVDVLQSLRSFRDMMMTKIDELCLFELFRFGPVVSPFIFRKLSDQQ